MTKATPDLSAVRIDLSYLGIHLLMLECGNQPPSQRCYNWDFLEVWEGNTTQLAARTLICVSGRGLLIEGVLFLLLL